MVKGLLGRAPQVFIAAALVGWGCGGRSSRSGHAVGSAAGGGSNDGSAAASGTAPSDMAPRGPDSAATGGVTADDAGTCVADGVRRSIGSNALTGNAPVGSCLFLGDYYCAGESYGIDEGRCTGTCTCLGNGNWSCDYDHPDLQGDCKAAPCVDDQGRIFELGFGAILEDGCTSCYCTPQGYLCTSTHCERRALCSELEQQYEQALPAALRCDPNNAIAQCTEWFPYALGCDSLEIPLNVTNDLAAIAFKFQDHGCFSSGCPATTRVRSPPRCSPEGVCTDGP